MTLTAPQATFIPPTNSAQLVPADGVLTDNVRFTLEAVTPERADELIAHLPAHQRRLDHGRVNRYARMMANGLWMVTDEPVKIAADRSVFDGQHRAYAAQAAYKLNPNMEPVVMRFAYNSDPATYRVLDQGKGRTFADLLSANPAMQDKIPAPKTVGAALRIIKTYEQCFERNDGYWVRPDITHTEALGLLELYPEVVNGVKPALTVTRNKIQYLSSVLVSLHYLASRTAPTLPIDEFFGRLADGIGFEDGSPIRAARNWAIPTVGQRRIQVSQTGKVEQHLKILINTFNNWATGTRMDKVNWKDGRMPKILGVTPKSLAA